MGNANSRDGVYEIDKEERIDQDEINVTVPVHVLSSLNCGSGSRKHA